MLITELGGTWERPGARPAPATGSAMQLQDMPDGTFINWAYAELSADLTSPMSTASCSARSASEHGSSAPALGRAGGDAPELETSGDALQETIRRLHDMLGPVSCESSWEFAGPGEARCLQAEPACSAPGPSTSGDKPRPWPRSSSSHSEADGRWDALFDGDFRTSRDAVVQVDSLDDEMAALRRENRALQEGITRGASSRNDCRTNRKRMGNAGLCKWITIF